MNLPDEKREAVAEVLARHSPFADGRGFVRCGRTYGPDRVDLPLMSWPQWNEHAADALAPLLAGWLAEAEAAVVREAIPPLVDAALARGLAEGEARLRARVEAVLAEGPDTWDGYETRDIGHAFLAESVIDFIADLRATLDADAAETTGGGE